MRNIFRAALVRVFMRADCIDQRILCRQIKIQGDFVLKGMTFPQIEKIYGIIAELYGT